MGDLTSIYDELRNARGKVPVWLTNSPKLRNNVERLRDALLEGIGDSVSIPEVSTDNSRAAHDLLGCPLYIGLLSTLQSSSTLPDSIRWAVNRVVVEATTSAAYRLITEGWDCLKKDYGDEHVDNRTL